MAVHGLDNFRDHSLRKRTLLDDVVVLDEFSISVDSLKFTVDKKEEDSNFVSSNFESNHNYVDRVRINNDPTTKSFNESGRGSGWRQKSLSSIDLTSNRKSKNVNPIEKYTELYDFYSRVTYKNQENIYGSNKIYQDLRKPRETETIYDHPIQNNINNTFGSQNLEACSLRRTRSLAVIREETFNDLKIGGIHTRRSQLIPRAKLADRKFDRYQHKYQLEDISIEPDTETSDLNKVDAFNKLNAYELQTLYHNDKSDLDSLDSNYFKQTIEIEHTTNADDTTTTQTNTISEPTSTRKQSLAETTTSDSSENLSTKREDSDSLAEIKFLDEILLSKELQLDNSDTTNTSSTTQTSSSDSSYDTLSANNQKLIIELKDSNSTIKRREELQSVISYDSIYLSSECSENVAVEEHFTNEKPKEDIQHSDESSQQYQDSIPDYETVLRVDEPIENPNPEHKVEIEECPVKIISTDPPYTQVTKAKPRIISLDPKVKKLKSFSDYSVGGTLERLSFISTGQFISHQNHQPEKVTLNYIDHQFYSLPDAQIGKSLIASERIDQKLRAICDENEENEDHTKNIYDSISRFGRAHKKIRQRENCEIVILNSISIEEQPKEAPAIEVSPLTIKEFKSPEQREYLTQLGLDSDCSYSIDTFDSPTDRESDTTTPEIPTTVNLGGKKVIVDEVAAKILNKEREEINNSVLKSSVHLQPPKKERIIPKIEITDVDAIVKKRQTNFSEIVRATPVKVTAHIINQANLYETKNRSKSLSSIIKSLNSPKMSRPQILQIVDSKRTHDNQSVSSVGNENDEIAINHETEEAFHKKVDLVRCYWSKLAKPKDDIDPNSNQVQQPQQQPQPQPQQNNQQQPKTITSYVTSVEDDNVKNLECLKLNQQTASKVNNINNNNQHVNDGYTVHKDNEEFQSFYPHVEIIELDDQKHAAVVKTEDTSDHDFDHVRYKVMKFDMFQKNLLSRNKKEAQFDGLIQYLQDYSFQELLTHNNVVIIEPVRTKIEKIGDKPHISHKQACKITGGAGEQENENAQKKHFFYHPVRVNKELLDDELPNPDTVKNVRKLFEEALRNEANAKSDDKSGSGEEEKIIKVEGEPKTCEQQTNIKNLRKRAMRYLTIDTVYDSDGKKWDSASLSSGISSGDLSYPCECGEMENSRFSSAENVCDEFCESHYVSQDILEKIRECGSSVTYYGGRVVDKRFSELSPMTKAIIQEIRGGCGNCQSIKLEQEKKAIASQQDSDNYLGVKFKLVKSNSCSSRLELIGANNHMKKCTEAMSHDIVDDENPSSSSSNRSQSPEEFAEESVRNLISRLETGAVNQSTAPKIIESKCIEKFVDANNRQLYPVTINNQLIDPKVEELNKVGEIITQVTVNNHLNFGELSNGGGGGVKHVKSTKTAPIENTTKPIITKAITKSAKDNENIVKQSQEKSNQINPNSTINQHQHHVQTFEEAKEMLTTAFKNIERPELPTTQQQQQQHHQTNHIQFSNSSSNDNEKQPIMTTFSADHPQTVAATTNHVKITNNNQRTVRFMDMAPTLNPKFDEKFYVANDVKLKEQKKYDEMEFEEFEVFDPTRTEFCDSLN